VFHAVSRIHTPWTGDPYATIAGHAVDPFNTLCENPDRLRQLLRHRMHPICLMLHLSTNAQ
jgi:hypothetical protein